MCTTMALLLWATCSFVHYAGFYHVLYSLYFVKVFLFDRMLFMDSLKGRDEGTSTSVLLMFIKGCMEY